MKPAIIFAITAAAIKSFSAIYFGFYALFYIVFIVAIGIAYFLRKHNLHVEKKLGTAAFLITLLYFFSVFVADWIILFVLYQYVNPLNIITLVISLFTSLNILVLIAAALSYFLAINKNIFRHFLPDTEISQKKETNLVENNNKSYHKEKKRF